MKQRREFIRSMTVAASFLATHSALKAFGPGPRTAGRGRSDLPECAEFERLRGTQFRVSDAVSGDQWLELDQVVRESRDDRVESFSVRFQGAAGAKLPERLYRFSHAECGAFEFFIKPGTTEGNRCAYRAVVCRLA